MTCVARTARRRRLQAAQGYTHLAKRQRPTFRKRTPEQSKAKQEEQRQKALRRDMARAASKKLGK